MERDPAAAAQVDAPGRVEERRDLGQPAAAALGCDRRELGAEVVRETHDLVPSSASSRRLYSTPSEP